jgi:hypothetical protein
MTKDELLTRIDEDAKFLEQYFGGKFKGQSALRAVVKTTQHPPVSDQWQWADGWKCAMLTIIQAIEKELNETK